MIFQFIRYTQPAWQFNLLPKTPGSFASCYINEDKMPENFLDERYQTKSAKLADAGYRLWNQGILLESASDDVERLHQMERPSLKDEYIFIRKYWGTAWACFALLIRLFSLKNPIKEIECYWQTRTVKRINPYQSPARIDDYENFDSELIKANPKVAVIIPTLNRYEYLKDVLRDLENQSYANFEVIIVDQSEPFSLSFYEAFKLDFQILHQKEKLLWTARNNAVELTDAEYLLFFDDDSRVQEDWIIQHLKCLDFFGADISAGISLAAVGQKISESYNYFRWADQFDSGNALVKRAVFKNIGLFDEQFNGQRMGDKEFGFRTYINGLHSISNPRASRIHLKVQSGGLREMGSWDGFRPMKWFAPKPVPSVIYLYKKYLPSDLANNALLIGIMLSNIPYKHKSSSRMLLLSIVLTVVKAPLLWIQFSRSKIIANRMLKNKNAIKYLTGKENILT